MDNTKLESALNQWRDSLVNLSSRNKLLNYKKTRSSTIEMDNQTSHDVFDRISTKAPTHIIGTIAEQPGQSVDDPIEADNPELDAFDYSVSTDSLFTKLTQVEVDKILRRISGVARREYLEKGISTLYLCLGALHWKDDSEDDRVSPLIMVPVALASSGFREPLRLERSDDDIAVNPALALKLLEFGISLPSSEAVISSIEEGGVALALQLFSDLKLNPGWVVKDISILSVFAFQKEAMYRDLLDNQDVVMENSIIRALGGGTDPKQSEFFFEEIRQENIDDLLPPESTPIVLDSDSSQRAAVAASLDGRSFVLDGPPGTGKSQTISNIIGALIAQGKSVLFVSEKIVALEVVKDRLDQRGLGAFLFELHSHKSTRKEVANRLGQALLERAVAPSGMSAADISKAKSLRTQLNDYAEAVNEVREPLGLSVHSVLGLIDEIDVRLATPTPEFSAATLSIDDLQQLRDALTGLEKGWDLYLAGPSAEWFGLENEFELEFRIDAAALALKMLEEAYEPVRSVASELGMGGTFSGGNLSMVLSHWSSSPDLQDEKWLTAGTLSEQEAAIENIAEMSKKIRSIAANCESYLGQRWDAFVDDSGAPLQSVYSNLDYLVSGWERMQLQSTNEYARILASTITHSIELLPVIQDFATRFGIKLPSTLAEIHDLRLAVGRLLEENHPPAKWVASRENQNAARAAFTKLRPLAESLARARVEAGIFSSGVLDLDLEEMTNFFSNARGLFKKFSGPYRGRKAKLLSCVSLGGWNQALPQIPLALAWQERSQALSNAEDAYSEALTPVYDSTETDWLAVEQAIVESQNLVAWLGVVDAERFLLALDQTAARRRLEAALISLGNVEEAWIELGEFPGHDLRSGLEDSNFEEVLVRIDAALGELSPLVLFQERMGEHVPSATSVEDVLKGLKEIAEYSGALQSFEPHLLTHSQSLNQTVNSSALTSPDMIDFLNRKLIWSQVFRGFFADTGEQQVFLHDSNSHLFDALKTSQIPPNFNESFDLWKDSWSVLGSSFSADQVSDLDEKVSDFQSAREYLESLRKSLSKVDSWFDLKKSQQVLSRFGLDRAVNAAAGQGLDSAAAAGFILKTALSHWVNWHISQDNRIGEDPSLSRAKSVELYRSLDVRLKSHSVSEIIRRAASRRPRNTPGQAGHIQREAEKKTRHIPVRELINLSRDVIQGLHPCFMMSPLAVSQYLPPDIKFDVVIFDEASQVTPADAINCAYRGVSLITAGDQKQLPPMSFFTASGLDEESPDADMASDYDSVLDLMKASGCFNSMSLNWHYRSRHENLIAFSNSAFYSGRLVTFPGAISESEDLGVKLIKVDGVYRRSAGSDNPIEAQEVAQRVIHHFDTRKGQSLGVVAFSTAQRDCIENALAEIRANRPDLERHFEGSRQDGFFVNSLESVQGDERDVIIFSVGYGPDELGKVYKNFGPLSRSGGERRLNVAVTRARMLVEVVSSMTASRMGEVNSDGARHLRKYLDFAERGPAALQLELGDAGLGTDSPFEDSVISSIRSWGYEVQPQVGVAGYRIDIGVKHPNSPGVFSLGVECDGAMYHSSKTARDRDRLRHEVLEGLGWRIHHIWGTSWYRHRDREMQRLRHVIEEQSGLPITGRLVERSARSSDLEVEVNYEGNEALNFQSWIRDYEVSRGLKVSSRFDYSNPQKAKFLVNFVSNVVQVEQPIHHDLLIIRFKEAAGLDKVGARIKETLNYAISLAKVQREGDFLWVSKSRKVTVRRAHISETRDISQIAPLELRAAVKGVIREATGIALPDLTAEVSQIFGWKRRGSIIEAGIRQQVDILVDKGELVLSAAGYRLGQAKL